MVAQAKILTTPPNQIIILSDNMVWVELLYDNQFFETPEIYRLARDGLRLTDFHLERVRRMMKLKESPYD